MRASRKLPRAAAGLLLGLVALAALAAETPPPPTRWVTDLAGFLSPGALQSLDARLEAYQRQTGHHVLVWIGRTTGGDPVEDFADRAFQAWKVGRKGMDDGLVLFLLAEDRKVRIEVGYGLEAQVPDLVAGRVIREIVVPRIQAGDRDGAVTAGVDALLAAIEGKPFPGGAPGVVGPGGVARPTPQLSTGQKILFGAIGLAILIFFITHPSLALYFLINILSSGGRGGGYRGGGFGGGGGWGGGGGGGGWSGGGGRSGGGGATGSW